MVCLLEGEVFINEFYYDNVGGDVNEFVEVVVENIFEGDLEDIILVFYNGFNGVVYNFFMLDMLMEGVDDGMYIYFYIELFINGL